MSFYLPHAFPASPACQLLTKSIIILSMATHDRSLFLLFERAAPAVFLMAVWTPLLQPLGLTNGEWFAAPTVPGALLLIALYAALAYLATALVLRWFRRER